MSPFHIYSSGHQHSQAVCEALAKGTRFPIAPAAPLLEGGLVTYGFLRGLLPTIRQAQALCRPWAYVDRAYFRASYGSDYSGYFRLTLGAWQHDGAGDASWERWLMLGIKLRPWSSGGSHILVCPPGEVFSQAVGGFSADSWLRSTLGRLAAVTDRPVRIRSKKDMGTRPLAADLVGCHALVTYMSNTAVEAVVAGVPVFCTGACAASIMGSDDISQIEKPRRPEGRAQWAANLAANQWTLDEFRRGKANHIFAEARGA